MIAAVRTWLTAVAAVSLLLSVVQYITPKGTLRDTASFIGGLLLLLYCCSRFERQRCRTMFTWALLNTKSR